MHPEEGEKFFNHIYQSAGWDQDEVAWWQHTMTQWTDRGQHPVVREQLNELLEQIQSGQPRDFGAHVIKKAMDTRLERLAMVQKEMGFDGEVPTSFQLTRCMRGQQAVDELLQGYKGDDKLRVQFQPLSSWSLNSTPSKMAEYGNFPEGPGLMLQTVIPNDQIFALQFLDGAPFLQGGAIEDYEAIVTTKTDVITVEANNALVFLGGKVNTLPETYQHRRE